MDDWTVREIRSDELPYLEDFLYEAIFIPEGMEPPERSILEKPGLKLYTEGFGTREGDVCLVAESGGKPVGAVWARIMPDYGHVDDSTPSLAIALYPEYRGKGIGTELMRGILMELKKRGFSRASLAVQKANRARRLYEKAGFEIAGESAEEYIMVCELKEICRP